jgi:hypothetical protein
MSLDRYYIETIATNARNASTNLAQDLGIFVKLEGYIDEIIEAYSHPERYDTLKSRNLIDRDLTERLIIEYRRIVADHGGVHNNISLSEGALRNSVILIPKVTKHIREGYLEFDEYEDTVE